MKVRIWATRTLREYLIKGFVLDDERLKQGKAAFGKDYFEELLERIREIRASQPPWPSTAPSGSSGPTQRPRSHPSESRPRQRR